MNTNKIKEYKKSLKLSSIQREIIIGLILGDGHLETQNNGKTYRLKIEQSIKSIEYIDWLYDNFREWVLTEPKEKIKKDIRFKKDVINVYFNTVSHSAFRFYANQFYNGKKKIVPKLIYRWLTPLSIASWFMDDGSIKSFKHKGKIINTQGFTKIEVKYLSDCLLRKYGIKSKLRRQKNNTWQLYLLSETIDKFYKIINPYIISSMRYKLINLG
jgi:hypothetical protein